MLRGHTSRIPSPLRVGAFAAAHLAIIGTLVKEHRRRTAKTAARPCDLTPAKERSRELDWRARQLNCLLAISELPPEQATSLEQVTSAVLALLPTAWPDPGAVCARIVLEDQEFATPNYQPGHWTGCADIMVSDKPVGRVEVGHLDSLARGSDGAFAREEQRLLIAVAARLGAIVQQRQSDQLMRTLSRAVEDNPATVMICDVHGNIERVNPGFTRLTGYSEQEVIGKNPRFLNAGQQPPEFYRAIWATITSGQEWQGEFINRKKDAQLFWERATISPVRGLDGFGREGRVTHFVKVAEDITARKRLEHSLSTAHGFLEIANRQTDMDALLKEFVAQIGRVTLCTAVGIRLLDEEQRVSGVASAGFAGAFDRADCCVRVGSAGCICGCVASGQADPRLACFTGGGSFHANDEEAFSLLPPGMADAPGCVVCAASGYQSMVVTPIRAQDRVLGLMYLADPRPNMVSSDRVQLFEEMGLLLGTAIERVRILEELRQAHDRLATVLELSGELVSTIDLPSLLGLILEKLVTVVPYDRAAIMTLSDHTLTVEASAGYREGEHLGQLKIELGDYSAVHAMIRAGEPLCLGDIGCLAREGRPVQDITGLPLSIIGTDTCSWLAAPLVVRDEVIGLICLGHHQSDTYESHVLYVVQSFANAVAVAISNARLYQQAQLRATAEERSRLAHELHDSVTQALFSANLIATALPAAYERDYAEATETLQKLLRLIRGALAQMRTLLMELVPEGLMDEQLGVLLGHLAQAMAAEIGAPVDLAVEGDCELPAEQRIALYRIAQEALYNIAKHAGASRVLVELTCGPVQTQLHICDNGRGFTPGSVPSSHMGVKIMRTRAEKAGAFFTVRSQPGSGTEITVTVPTSGRRRP